MKLALKLQFIFCVILLIPFTVQAGSGTQKIHPWVLSHTESGAKAEFFIVLKEQADLSPAAQLARKIDKGRYVYAVLRDVAERSQAPVQAWLKAKGIQFQSFYSVNALLVKGDRSLAETLASRPDVDRIEGNPLIKNDLPKMEPAPQNPAAIEPNITKTRAPEVWALGFTGVGIVVGDADTGQRWTHQALKPHYRGWDGTAANHDYNWHDSIHNSTGNPCGNDSPQPCDDFGHGSHTMGTVIGDDGGNNKIGMAPGAKWIGCRNMDEGVGTPARYIECFDFWLAPYPIGGQPSDGDPTLAPDLTTNSWGCPPSEGCSDLTLQAAVNGQEAAGIMTVVAAGNSGSSCGSVDDPPSLYASSYTVGATDNNDNMAGFSSRGPADTTGLMKPNIVAPGVNERSSINSSDSSYASFSGTSMATPNVAGGVALVWSAAPFLRNQQIQTEAALNAAAVRLPSIVEGCGGDYVNGPNNTWGNGRLDVFTTVTNSCPAAPLAPANFVSSQPGGTYQVDLSWDAVTGATSYEVYRATGSCPGSTLLFLATTANTTLSDSTVTPGNTYSYIVRAIDGAGCASPFSTCTDEAIQCIAPAAPANLVSSLPGGNQVDLSWDPVSGAAANQYEVHRGDGVCPGTNVNLLNTTANTTYSDTTVTAGNTYSYMVKTVDGFGCTSAFSNCTDESLTVPCLFCDDFEDGVLASNWNYIKLNWAETGGNLVGTPVSRKAIAVASPAFAGCSTCSVQTQMQTAGGIGNKVWFLGWYVDKNNTIELLMKQETGKFVLKQRVNGQVVGKSKASMTINPGVFYNVTISFDGTTFTLSVNGSQVLTLTASGTPNGTVGFQVKNTTGTFAEINVN